MSIEGEIQINVTVWQHKIKSVLITSSRPLHITTLLVNKSIDYVAGIINTIYQLCNTAHRFAFLRLLDQSSVIKLSQNEILAYQLLLDLETIREHCFSIATKWCQKTNTVDDNIINLLTTLKKINLTLFASADSLSLTYKTLCAFNDIEKLLLTLENQLEISLLGTKYKANKIFLDLDTFNYWKKNSTNNYAIFLNNLEKNSISDLGNIEVFHLPKLDTKILSGLLNNEYFIKHPNYQNICYETTPYSRQFKAPLIQQLNNHYGNGLLTRSTAQLLEVFKLLNKIKHNYTNIKAEKINYNMKYPINKTSAITQLEAARGRLVHQFSIKDEKIKSYQILAPTEWNFHPQGVLYKMIKSLHFVNKKDLMHNIRLLVNAIDPCVGYNVKIDYA